MTTRTNNIHHTTYGSCGRALLLDRDGYTHESSQGWLASPDAYDARAYYESARDVRAWAARQATASRRAIKSCQTALSQWQDTNR